jgi:hypothetical protein
MNEGTPIAAKVGTRAVKAPINTPNNALNPRK